MIRKFRVYGNSMLPTFKEGNVVLARTFFLSLKVDDIIVIRHSGKARPRPESGFWSLPTSRDPQNDDIRYIIKRIQKIQDKKYFVVGDNEKESTDSREFGWIGKAQIVGKVITKNFK